MILDLCSGLGGASQAFVDNGVEVIRVDIDRGFKPTIQADVQQLPIRSDLKPELVIFCPPCNCFSIASVYRHWDNGKPRESTKKAIQLVKNGMKEIQRLKPKYWIMENPMGMLRKAIGKPTSTIRQSDFGSPHKKLTDLWGNVPFKMRPVMGNWLKAPRGDHRFSIQGRPWSSVEETIKGPNRSALRAKLPYGFSEALYEATIITYQSEGKQ